MEILCALLWGMLVCITMFITNKYYVTPMILCRQNETSEVLKDPNNIDGVRELNCDTEQIVESALLRKKHIQLIVLGICALYAMICGYYAACNSLSTMGLFKMSIAFITLSCIFVTDIRMFIIPNFCSLILLVGRLIILLFEFIFNHEGLVIGLFDSFIALISSLIILIIVSKIAKGGLGYGDIKIISCLGFLCGIRSVYFTLLLALITCAFFSTLLLIIRKKKVSDLLPLGPFIWIGFGLSIILSLI